MRKFNLTRVIIAAILVVAALISFTVLSSKMSNPENFKDTYASLDEKSETVLKLSGASTLASVAISAIPGDAAAPIAQKLADFSEYFLLVLSVLFTEKYLLTIIGKVVFRYLAPAALLFLAGGVLFNNRSINAVAVKVLALSAILAFFIPASVAASDMVYDTYRVSIDNTIAGASELAGETEETKEEEEGGLFSRVISSISGAATDMKEKAVNLLNNFIEGLAVMLVTACVIPILVLLFCFWLLKLLTGVDVITPGRELAQHRRGFLRPREGKEPKTTEITETT